MKNTSLIVRPSKDMIIAEAKRRIASDVTKRSSGDPFRSVQRAAAFDARAFDAAGGAGYAFLQGQLEQIDPDKIEPLQETTHPRDIEVRVGGGFPQWISLYSTNYTSSGNQQYGLQGTNNTEIAQAQFDIQKALIPTYVWASGFTIPYADLERLNTAKRFGQEPPFSIQEAYEESVATVWNKMLDGLVYLGFQGSYGLCNNANSPSFVVNSGAWAAATPTQILDSINQGINYVVANSGFTFTKGCPNTLLVPLQPQFSVLTRPMTLNGVGWGSTIDYIKKHCVAAAFGIELDIQPLPNPFISGQGLGGSDRAVLYRKDPKSLYIRIPQPAKRIMTVPTTKDGVGYETVFMGCVSPIAFRRTITMTYMDAI